MKLNHLNKYSIFLWRFLLYYYKITKEFIRSTAINGSKYLTFEFLTLWEKLLFLCFLIIASYNSFYFAMSITEKWRTSPVITSMNSQATIITTEPFPAVTICNMNQAQYSKVKNFDINSVDYAMLQKLCFRKINFTSLESKQQSSKKDGFSNFIVKNTQPCSHMLYSCKYGSLEITCSDLFRELILDEGMCCTFNVVHPYMLYKGDYFLVRDYTSNDGPAIPLDWSPEKGYPKELPRSFYPRMIMGSGMSNCFTIILNGDLDNYFCSSTNGPGFKVSFHNPIDIPRILETGLTVALGYQTRIQITTLKEEADEAVRTSVKPKERQCYFSDEHPLHYFHYYSRLNCEMECDAQFMLGKCNCLEHHMSVVYNNVTECHVKHFNCVIKAKKDYTDQTLLACRKECLPNCNELYYIPRASFSALDNGGFIIKNPYLRNMSKETLNNHAVLEIFFPSNYYRGNVKKPYIGFTEFVSQVGGIMCIMMGFSVISLVEIVYFFFLKPLLHVWRRFFNKNTVHIMDIKLNSIKFES